MQKKITTKFLESVGACQEGIRFVNSHYENKETINVLNHLIQDDKLDWANWLIVRVMEYKQYVAYAIFSAEQVIDIFEKAYPKDKRPREAIKAAKKCLTNPSKENKEVAAAYAAYSVYSYAAYAAAYAAAYSVYSYAAYTAAYAAASYAVADYTIDDAVAVADYAANITTNASAANAAATNVAARKKMRLKILKFGIKQL